MSRITSHIEPQEGNQNNTDMLPSDELIDTLLDTFTYSGTKTTLSATCWHKVDTLIPSKVIYGCLSSVTASSGVSDIASAIVKLNSVLSGLG